MMTGVMMTDLSAAYDQLSIEKARLMGLTEDACSWLMSFIAGRSQQTIVDGYISAALKLPAYSVPQGSVGTPLIFRMANSDLPDAIHNHEVSFNRTTGHCKENGDSIHFVDDGIVTFAHKEPAVIIQVLTEHYNTIAKYMAANKFVINDDKTHLLVMAPRRLAERRKKVSIQARHFIIKPSESESLLSIHRCQTNFPFSIHFFAENKKS